MLPRGGGTKNLVTPRTQMPSYAPVLREGRMLPRGAPTFFFRADACNKCPSPTLPTQMLSYAPEIPVETFYDQIQKKE